MVPIGITQRVSNFPERDERRDCLDRNWGKLLIDCNFLPIPLFNLQEYLEDIFLSLELKGIILSGGNDINGLSKNNSSAPERDDFEYKIIDYCTKQNIPILGICRGFQILINYYGGKLLKINNHVATTHKIEIINSKLLPVIPDLVVNSYHDYGVLPAHTGELEVAALSTDGYVEAAAHPMHNQLGIMWHPERKPDSAQNYKLIQNFFNEK
jgi:N5-(cytidine 5'-diphosphoramidyl)-L-glutamine hydrolase